MLAVGVLQAAGVAPFHLRLWGKQYIVVGGGDDEQVVVAVVADGAQGLGGGLFGIRLGQAAGLGQGVEVLEDAGAAFHLVLRLHLAVLHHGGAQAAEADSAQGDQAEQHHPDEQAHACGDGQVA